MNVICLFPKDYPQDYVAAEMDAAVTALVELEGIPATDVTITASEVSQYSQEDQRWGGGHGVFTYDLLEGLNGHADADQDRIVTLGELFEFVRDRVQRETRNAQVPTVSQTPWDRSWPMSIVLEATGGPVAVPRPSPEPPAPRPAAVPPGAPTPAAGLPATQVTGVRPYPGTGVWLRMNLGGGQTSFDADGASISGSAGQVSFAVGKVLARKVPVFAVVSTDLISGPKLTVGNVSVTADEDVTASQVGFGVGVGLMTEGNMLLSAAVLFPKMTLEDAGSGASGDTKVGAGLELVLAKDWPVGAKLSLGVGVRAFFGSMKDEGSDDVWNTKAFGITGSLMWMPKGLPVGGGR